MIHVLKIKKRIGKRTEDQPVGGRVWSDGQENLSDVAGFKETQEGRGE